jgi:hypothetical protein
MWDKKRMMMQGFLGCTSNEGSVYLAGLAREQRADGFVVFHRDQSHLRFSGRLPLTWNVDRESRSLGG